MIFRTYLVSLEKYFFEGPTFKRRYKFRISISILQEPESIEKQKKVHSSLLTQQSFPCNVIKKCSTSWQLFYEKSEITP